MNISQEYVCPDRQSILIIKPQASLDAQDWVKQNKLFIEQSLLTHGGVLLRGFDICSISEFRNVIKILSPNLLEYQFRSTPRTRLGSNIYTSTEYPANRSIPLHNENSYTNNWPEKIYFFSIIVAESGGETPLADSRRVYNNIDESVRKKFEAKQVTYIRNYSGAIDLSWHEVFQTSDVEMVNLYCEENSIAKEWSNNFTELSTWQVCPAVLKHPTTNESVWFNQAHLFHESALTQEERQSLIEQLGRGKLPRNSFYGDGEPIEDDVLAHIREVYQAEKIKFKWQRGDCLILDNLLMSHAREPYQGERKVVVAMSWNKGIL